MIFNITADEAGLTVKKYLFDVLGYSCAAVKRVKYRDCGIMLNGERVTVRKVLAEGDILSVAIEDTEEDENEYTVPAELDIGIVYEDEYLTVVNKPPMMPAHPSLGHKNDTVANALAWRYRDIPYVFRPVNRLDRDTSGVMLTTRDKVTAGKLYRSMRRGEIKKSYIAVVEGVLPESKGRLVSYMCREGDSIVKRRICSEDEPRAKIAVTEYEVVESNGKASVVRVTPVTGRTHQLRLHFASCGCPIFGDTMYGNECEHIGRQALHASSLVFAHPQSGEMLELSAEVPADIRYLLDNLGFNIEKIKG